MDSNLRRSSGRFASFAARTLLGFSLLAGCITTAVAQENPGFTKSKGANIGVVDAHNHLDFPARSIQEAK